MQVGIWLLHNKSLLPHNTILESTPNGVPTQVNLSVLCLADSLDILLANDVPVIHCRRRKAKLFFNSKSLQALKWEDIIDNYPTYMLKFAKQAVKLWHLKPFSMFKWQKSGLGVDNRDLCKRGDVSFSKNRKTPHIHGKVCKLEVRSWHLKPFWHIQMTINLNWVKDRICKMEDRFSKIQELLHKHQSAKRVR